MSALREIPPLIPIWVDHLEQVRVVRNFMANPLWMIVIEAFGTLCLLMGVTGVPEGDDSSLDTVWGGYQPLFIGACLTPLFVRGLFRPGGCSDRGE